MAEGFGRHYSGTSRKAHVAHMGGLEFKSLFFEGLKKSFRGEERRIVPVTYLITVNIKMQMLHNMFSRD